jgi:hypothetical protein
MSAPAIRSIGASKSSTSTLTYTWPTHQTNDIALLWVQSSNQTISLSDAQGFAELTPQVGTGTAATAGSVRLSLWWCRASSGAMPAPTIADAGEHVFARMVTVSGCVTTGNPWGVVATATNGTASTSVSAPTVTTVANDARIFAAIANAVDATADQASGFTNASLTGFSETYDFNRQPATLGGGISCASGVRATAGVVSATTATLANASKTASITVALQAGSTTSTPPVFQAAGTAVTGTGSVTPTWPTHAQDDIALLIVTSANETISLTTASGFVQTADSPQSTGTTTDQFAVRVAVYWCRATSSSMASPVVADSGNHTNAQILTFRGCIASGNPWDVTAGDVLATASATVTVPGDTTTVANCLVVAISADSIDTTSTNQYSGWTNASLASITEIADYHSGTGNGTGFGVACGVKAVAGAYSATTATLASSGGGATQARISLALKPPTTTAIPAGDPSVPHRYWRMNLKTTPGSGPKVNQFEMDERNSPAGGFGSTIKNPAQMHPGVTHIRPMFASGGGTFDIDVAIMTLPAGYSIDIPADQVTRTVDTFADADGILKPGVGQSDGAGSLPLVKGFVEGAGRHGDPIVFDDFGRVFQNVPFVEVTGGINTQPAALWGTAAAVEAGTASSALTTTKPQYADIGARNLDENGFEIQARLRQKGAETAQTIAFATTHLDSAGDTVTIGTLTNAPSNNDQYGVDMFGFANMRSKNGQPFRVYMDYIIETTIDSGTSWQARASGSFILETSSLTYQFFDVYRFHKFIVIGSEGPLVGISSDGTDRVQVRMPRDIHTEGLGDYILTDTRIQAVNFFFNTGTDSFANKTPDTTDEVHWKATGWV